MKPITLISLSLFGEDDNPAVEEPINTTFFDFKDMQLHITERKLYWSKVLKRPLKVDPQSVETLITQEAKAILHHVCEFMGVDYARASSDLRDTEYVEARRSAINICFMRKMGKSSIGKGLGMNHASVIYHINKHKDLSKTDKYYESRFIQTYEYAMEKMGGNYREDGSGEKLES